MSFNQGNKGQNLVFAGQCMAFLQICLRQYERAQDYADNAVTLSRKQQLFYFESLSKCMLGHARAQLGSVGEGIALIREGIAGLLKTGSRLGVSRHTALAGEGARVGRTSNGRV